MSCVPHVFGDYFLRLLVAHDLLVVVLFFLVYIVLHLCYYLRLVGGYYDCTH